MPLITPDTTLAGDTELFDAFRMGADLNGQIQQLTEHSKAQEADIVGTLRSYDNGLHPGWMDRYLSPTMAQDAIASLAEKAQALNAKKRLNDLTQAASGLFVGRSVLVTPVDETDKPFARANFERNSATYEDRGYGLPKRAKGTVTGLQLAQGKLYVKPPFWSGDSIVSWTYRHIGAKVLREDGEPRVHINFTD